MDPRRRTVIAGDLRTRAAPEHWTPWRLVQAIAEQAQCPTLLMAWRLAAGQSQRDVVVGVQGLAADNGKPCAPAPSSKQLSRWENGHEHPGPYYRHLLGLWFRTTTERLGLARDDPVVTLVTQTPADPQPIRGDEEDDVDRRQFLSLAAVTPLAAQFAPLSQHLDNVRHRMDTELRHVLPTTEVERWHDITTGHVAAYGHATPTDLLARLSPDLADLTDLIGEYPHETQLRTIASRLAGLVGAVHTDLGQDRPARDWLHIAARHARLSTDINQRYWVAMAQAITAYYGPTPGQAARIADKARSELGDTPSAPATQLAGIAARAHARTGDTTRARSELDRAQHLSDRLTPDQANEPFFGFPAREMLMYRSQVLTAIDDRQAPTTQQQALHAYPADDPMDRPLILVDQARHLARHGEPDQAADTAATALERLDPPMRVPLLIDQARALTHELRAPDIADQYRQRLASLAS